MSLHNMNEHRFSPHKDYTANRLRSGILQLADHTNLVIDETKLEPGQLDTTGLSEIKIGGWVLRIKIWAQLFQALLRGQLVKCFMTLQPNTLIFFVEKMRKASHMFQQKIFVFFRY